jgi:hypothetical protein
MQQRVDPFIPVRGSAAAGYAKRPVEVPRLRQVVRVHRTSPHIYESTLDGFVRSSPALERKQPVAPVIPESPWRQSVKPVERQFAKPVDNISKVKNRSLRRTLHAAEMPLAMAGAVGVGLLAPSLSVGEIAIGAYGLFAVARGVASRTTFLLALTALGVIIAALGLQGSDSETGQNFAVYAFLLLVVGTVSLGIEARREYI